MLCVWLLHYWLDFVMGAHYVLCEVLFDSLYLMYIKFSLQSCKCGCTWYMKYCDGFTRSSWIKPVITSLKPNDLYRGRTARLTSTRWILYIYSTNIGTEYFKYGIYSPFFPLQTAVCFIILTYSVPVLFTFYIQDVLKLRKIPAPKG